MKLIALMKKEFHRFFHDPRLIITMLLPGVLIFLLYTFIGEIAHSDDRREFKVYLSGSSAVVAVIEQTLSENEDKVEWLPLEDEEAARAAVRDGEATAILKFSENFDLFGEDARVGIIYDNGSEDSTYFYSVVSSILIGVGMRFPIEAETVKEDAAIGAEILSGLLPMLIVCFIFSACMSVTLESVAGEKERGTLSTILVTSAKRSHIALGKIIPLSCISMLGALSSFLGVALSMPKLMGLSLGFLGGYSVWSYILMLVLILSTVPLIVSAIAAVSALSRSVKEASAYTGVLMIFTMVLSIVTSFLPAMGSWISAVPIFNAVVSMQGILKGELPVLTSLLSVGINLVYTALLVFILTKLLSSERIMFGK